MEIQHIPQTPIRQGRTEDGNIVLIRPVVNRPHVVNLFPQSVNDLGRRPVNPLLLIQRLALLLLVEHLVQDRNHPVLKLAVVGVGNHEVADAVESLLAELGAGGVEGRQIGVAQALNEIFLDAARRRDDGGDVLVLDEPAEDGAEAAGDEVGGVTEEDGCPDACFGVPPFPLSL
jgi:hypothetical protein